MKTRKNTAVALGLLTVLTVASAAQATLMVTGFESDAVGSTPSDWFKTSGAALSEVSDEQAKTGSQSWKVVSAIGGGSTGFSSAEADRPAVSTFSFSFYISNPTYARVFHEQFDSLGDLAIQLEFRADSFGIRTYTGTGPLPRKIGDMVTLNAWHDVVLDVNYNTRTYDLTFDGSLVEAGLGMGGTTGIGTKQHRFSPGSVANIPVYIDDVSLVVYPGDANGDGMVNLADLQILGDNWQSTTATWSEADFTGDGSVNLADLQILGDNWGYGTTPDISWDDAAQLTGIPLPEPATSLLMALASPLLVQRRRRQTSRDFQALHQDDSSLRFVGRPSASRYG